MPINDVVKVKTILGNLNASELREVEVALLQHKIRDDAFIQDSEFHVFYQCLQMALRSNGNISVPAFFILRARNMTRFNQVLDCFLLFEEWCQENFPNMRLPVKRKILQEVMSMTCLDVLRSKVPLGLKSFVSRFQEFQSLWEKNFPGYLKQDAVLLLTSALEFETLN